MEESIMVREDLEDILTLLCLEKSYVQFYIGRNGEFDILAASTIKTIRQKYPYVLCDLILILPYTVRDIEYYADYYDQIMTPDELQGMHPKRAIDERNRWAVEHADLVLVYVENEHGGAYRAREYAKKIGCPLFETVKPTSRDDYDELRGLCRISDGEAALETESQRSMDQYPDYYMEAYEEYSEYNDEDFR